MMKILAFATVLGALAGCAREPERRADPAVVERLALANDAAPDAPKLEKADRIAASVERSEPDRLAGAAEALLAR